MDFIPKKQPKPSEVPYYEDATSNDGWQGQATNRTIDALKSLVSTSISRLGGMVTGFQEGSFPIGHGREGYRIYYTTPTADGKQLIPGQIDVVALPVRRPNNAEKSLKMALYMLKVSIDGLWFLQQLSPGYAPLMPFMLIKDGKTLTKLWSESAQLNNLLPPGSDTDFIVDGEIKEIK